MRGLALRSHKMAWLARQILNPSYKPYPRAPADSTDAQTAMIDAIVGGAYSRLRVLLWYGLTNDAPSEVSRQYGTTPLVFAVRRNDLRAMRLILEVCKITPSYDHPLQVAMTESDEEAARLLVQFGIKPSFKWMDSVKPARWDLMLELGAVVNERIFWDGNTPLGCMAEKGQRDAVLYLLQHGAQVNVYNDNGYTPLMLAVWSKQTEIARLLLDSGADVHARDNEGKTALRFALAPSGDASSVELLIERGADPNHRDSKGRTALHMALLLDNYVAAAILLKNGAKLCQAACSCRHK